jgi:hypothetical protein
MPTWSASTRFTLLGSLAGALLLWFPAFRTLDATGFGDWQFFHHMWEAGYVALTRHGEWPLWDPYHCGGITILGNPQSQHFSPVYLLALLAGPTLGSKLFLLAHAWAGFAGMYVLARKHELSVAGAVLASLTWAASGFFASHGSGGHSAFMPFYLAPWLLLAWRAAATDVRHAVSVAALLVLTLLEGGVYPFPYFVLLLAFDAGLRLVMRENVRGVLLAGAVSAVLTGLGGAIRLLPILEELGRNPRTMQSKDGVTFAEVLEMLTARKHGWRYEGHPFVWPEYVTYVGYGVLALALVGLVWSLRQRKFRVAVGLVVFMGLMMGDHGPASPWALVHRLPVYDSLRVPSRFAVFFTLYLGLVAGLGLDALRARFSKLAPATYVIIGGIFLDLLIVHFPTINRWRDPPVRTDVVSDRYYLSTLNYGQYYASFPRMHLGSRGCYEAMTFTPAKGLWTGDRPQARVVQGSGELLDFSRTNNRVALRVRMEEPGRLLLNQNYAPGFHASVGEVVEHEGKLALTLPAGEHAIALRYLPSTLVPGLVLSALGLLLGLAVWRWGPSLLARYSLERSK